MGDRPNDQKCSRFKESSSLLLPKARALGGRRGRRGAARGSGASGSAASRGAGKTRAGAASRPCGRRLPPAARGKHLPCCPLPAAFLLPQVLLMCKFEYWAFPQGHSYPRQNRIYFHCFSIFKNNYSTQEIVSFT